MECGLGGRQQQQQQQQPMHSLCVSCDLVLVIIVGAFAQNVIACCWRVTSQSRFFRALRVFGEMTCNDPLRRSIIVLLCAHATDNSS